MMLLFFLFIGCESETHKPFVTNDEIPPQVTNIKVDNFAGSSRITYSLPNDPNILYVLAKYTLSNGNEAQTKSSVYKNFLQVDGFSISNDYQVKLYTVSRTEVRSEPIIVTVKPLRAPVHEVKESLTAMPTFGGVNVHFVNPGGGEFVLHTLVRDSSGSWSEYDRLYTSSTERNYSLRGFDAIPIDFKFFFTDKWQNASDTLTVNITPYFEEEFDKKLWKDAALADDSNVPRYGALSQLWTPGPATYFFIKPDMPGLTIPNWWTIDLGKEYLFGRMLVHNVSHADSWMYARGTPEVFEIWGSNVKSTNWNDWTLLGEFKCEKPSGSPLGTITDEDRTQIFAGDTYDFSPSSQSFRYVRFKTLKTFGNVFDTYLLELTFFGKAIN